MAGYTSGLSAIIPNLTITNRAVGHSVSLKFTFHGNQNFKKYDTVIIENFANDEINAKYYGGVDYFENIYFEIFSTIANQTNLYFLGCGTGDYLENPSDIYFCQKNVAEACGATFVSMRDFIVENGRSIVEDHLKVMTDAAHPNRAIAQQFGHKLGRIIMSDARQARKPSAKAVSYAHKFHRASLSQLFKGRSIFRSTSLTGRHLAVMRLGDAIDLPKPIKSVGLYVDFGNTYCFMRLSGRDDSGQAASVTKRLYFGHGGRRLQLRFVPFRPGFAISRIEVVSPVDAFEDSLNVDLRDTIPEPIAMISGIAGWDGPITDRGIPRQGVSTALCQPMTITCDKTHVIPAKSLPCLGGWYAPGSIAEGRSGRWTGTCGTSLLLFDFEPGNYEIRLIVPGAVSLDAILGLTIRIGGTACPCTVTNSDAGFVVSARFTRQRAGISRIEIRVSKMQKGYGVLVEEISLGPAATPVIQADTD